MKSAFTTYHPAVCFALLVLAIALTMVVRHPVFLAVSLLCAIACYATTCGPQSLDALGWLLPLFVAVAAINPLFNTMGETVLFTYLGRPYTLEALCYGAATGAMVVAVFVWFACFNVVLTSDKIAYLFRKVAPAGALVLTMVLRLVPTYQKKTTQFAQARACIGKAAGEGTWLQKVKNGTTLLSMLTAWALEGSVVTADSMRSRGFGLPGRTFYTPWRFLARDAVLAAVLAVLFAGAVAGLLAGVAQVAYIPAIDILPIRGAAWGGVLCYAAFLAVPTVLNVVEIVQWRISLSRI